LTNRNLKTVFIINPLTPIDIYGMFQIKVTWTILFYILRVQKVKKQEAHGPRYSPHIIMKNVF